MFGTSWQISTTVQFGPCKASGRDRKHALARGSGWPVGPKGQVGSASGLVAFLGGWIIISGGDLRLLLADNYNRTIAKLSHAKPRRTRKRHHGQFGEGSSFAIPAGLLAAAPVRRQRRFRASGSRLWGRLWAWLAGLHGRTPGRARLHARGVRPWAASRPGGKRPAGGSWALDAAR
jgi:hypothetical protein